MANILTEPEAINAVDWTKTRSVVTANDTTAPDGTTTADLLVDDDGGGGDASIIFQQGINISTSTQHVLSVFAKKGQLDWALIQVASLTGLTLTGSFDLTNGVTGSAGADVDDLDIVDYGDGWYRCILKFTTASDGLGTVVFYNAEADGDATVARDGTSSVYWWGMYLNEGTEPDRYVSESGITVYTPEELAAQQSSGKKGRSGKRRAPRSAQRLRIILRDGEKLQIK